MTTAEFDGVEIDNTSVGVYVGVVGVDVVVGDVVLCCVVLCVVLCCVLCVVCCMLCAVRTQSPTEFVSARLTLQKRKDEEKRVETDNFMGIDIIS